MFKVHVETPSAMCLCYSYREGCRFVASKVLEDINVKDTILLFAAGNVDNIITGYLAPYQCRLQESLVSLRHRGKGTKCTISMDNLCFVT